ncbi:MAG TPA: response regulator transcription factor [Bacteroidales bacterium]|nr:response regulator transcription factor [Bacteroidales bacterium]HSA44552.1 response regulator transcription factor [Bacteroidales bacterium]
MNEKTRPRILYVEDDVTLGFVTSDNLEKKGYAVSHCEDGARALELFREQPFDLCILDVMLPVMDGFSLAEKIRETNHHIPILFLTAKSMTEDKIQGLSLGGDDYITKPYSMDELVLKMEVFLRRSRVTEPASPGVKRYQIGLFLLDTESYTLTHETEVSKLTYKEAELLRYLFENRDEVLKRQDILIAVWGDDSYLLSRSLDVFISRLRKLLKPDKNIQIKSIHGIGFRFQIRSED